MTRGRKKGHPKTGGRKADVNGAEKVRNAVIAAFNDLGGAKYLVEVAKINPSVFCSLLGKLLPAPEPPASGGTANVLVLRWVTPEIAQARGMIEMTSSKEPGQD